MINLQSHYVLCCFHFLCLFRIWLFDI